MNGGWWGRCAGIRGRGEGVGVGEAGRQGGGTLRGGTSC